MPNDDIGHPIADLTGYITEGQIVLDRELDRRGIYPPVRVLPSLSRLMNSGIGAGFTHPDHPALANQLFASYARATRVRVLASVMGEESLPEVDRRFLEFGRQFEEQLVNQQEGRTLEESMALGGSCCAALPVAELTRLTQQQVARYLSEGRRCLSCNASSRSPGSRSWSSRTSSGWCRKATSCWTRSASCWRRRFTASCCGCAACAATGARRRAPRATR